MLNAKHVELLGWPGWLLLTALPVCAQTPRVDATASAKNCVETTVEAIARGQTPALNLGIGAPGMVARLRPKPVLSKPGGVPDALAQDGYEGIVIKFQDDFLARVEGGALQVSDGPSASVLTAALAEIADYAFQPVFTGPLGWLQAVRSYCQIWCTRADQAATLLDCDFRLMRVTCFISIPSRNFTPSMTFASHSNPRSRRQLRSAHRPSL